MVTVAMKLGAECVARAKLIVICYCRDELVSVVIKPSNQLKITFLEVRIR